MEDFDNLILEESSRIENSHWSDLTLEEISLIKDSKKRIEYQSNWKHCFRYIINPLYSSIKNQNKFHFSNPDNMLTCRNMLKDLMDYYYNKGFSRDQIIKIVSDNDIKKKY